MTKRLFLTTGGHSTPFNNIERAVQEDVRGRWFDRFLKGIANGVELEAYAEAAVTPDNAAYLDTARAWEHRRFAQWPPAFARQPLYLPGTRALSGSAPPAVEVGPLVQHRIQAGFTPAAYVALGGGRAPAQAYARIPRLEFAFESPPLSEATEVIGRGAVELYVADSTGTFQLSAELSHVHPAGSPTYITHGPQVSRILAPRAKSAMSSRCHGVPLACSERHWRPPAIKRPAALLVGAQRRRAPLVRPQAAMGSGGLRGAGAGQHLLRLDLRDIAHVVPAGHKLRLAVVNLATHRPPGDHRIHFVPYFTATDTTVLMQPGAASRVLLPLRPYATNMKPRLAQASASIGIDHRLLVNGGAARAGYLYVTAMSLSGQAPGFALPGLATPVPLNFDAWTNVGFAFLGTPMLPAFVGVLDAVGQATPGLRVPPLNGVPLLGQRVTFAGVVVDPALTFDSVFGPCTLLVGL